MRAGSQVLGVLLDGERRRATRVPYVGEQGREFEQPAEVLVPCAFGLGSRTVLGPGVGPAFTVAATAVAIAAVPWVAHRVPDRSTEGRPHRQYDQPARAEFVAKVRVMISWLAAAGRLWVAVPVFLARPGG